MRRLGWLLVVALVGILPAAPAMAETITDLDKDPLRHQGEVVVIVGELVGDFGRRGGFVWTQINDDAYGREPIREGGSLVGGNTGLAVAIPEPLFDEVLGPAAAPGGYRTKGPIVEVTAVFHYHDEDRSGETWLEASQVELLEADRPLSEPQRLPLALAGVVLGILGLALQLRNRREL